MRRRFDVVGWVKWIVLEFLRKVLHWMFPWELPFGFHPCCHGLLMAICFNVQYFQGCESSFPRARYRKVNTHTHTHTISLAIIIQPSQPHTSPSTHPPTSTSTPKPPYNTLPNHPSTSP